MEQNIKEEAKECSICTQKVTGSGGDLMDISDHSKRKLFEVFSKFL